jgi:hypothetical protein
MNKGEIVAGIAACLLGNFALALLAFGPLGGSTPLVLLLANVAAIVVAAVRGHKAFAVGFALGYVAMFVLALGACFIAIASYN